MERELVGKTCQAHMFVWGPWACVPRSFEQHTQLQLASPKQVPVNHSHRANVKPTYVGP